MTYSSSYLHPLIPQKLLKAKPKRVHSLRYETSDCGYVVGRCSSTGQEWYASFKQPEGWLVIVGILTLLALAYQANEMRKATDAMRDSTKTVKRQAEIMERQSAILEKSVVAAEAKAIAAKENAEALINSERAWIMVDVKKHGPQGILQGSSRYGAGPVRQHASITISYSCRNEGKTPAWIVERRVRFLILDSEELLPNDPDLNLEINHPEVVALESEPISPNQEELTIITRELHCDGVADDQKFMVVYGKVRYRDIFDREVRETRFGYRVNMQGGFFRLVGFALYNKYT
jgi:hypothetical protein